MTFGTQYKYLLCLISNFRRVVNVVFFLLGDSPASEFYVQTFQNNVCSILTGGVSKKNPMKMEECSETSAHKIYKPENHPKERLQYVFTTFYLLYVLETLWARIAQSV